MSNIEGVNEVQPNYPLSAFWHSNPPFSGLIAMVAYGRGTPAGPVLHHMSFELQGTQFIGPTL